MTEAEFQRTVIEMAQRFGWKTAHFSTASGRAGGWFTPVQGDGKGFPDLILLRNGRMVVAELKSEKGRLSAAQGEWLDEFMRIAFPSIHSDRVLVRVWRPSMLGEIEKVLR